VEPISKLTGPFFYRPLLLDRHRARCARMMRRRIAFGVKRGAARSPQGYGSL